jgi:hypothetical protein
MGIAMQGAILKGFVYFVLDLPKDLPKIKA